MERQHHIPLFWKITALAVLFPLACYWAYWSQLHYHFVVPVGGDSYNHVQTTIAILQGRWLDALRSYRPLFHIVIAGISYITKEPLLSVFAWFTPILLVLSACSLGFFASRWLKSPMVFWMVFALSIFFALQPYQIWGDGGFPNVFASYVLMPFALWALYKSFITERANGWLLAYFGLAILIVASHELTTITFGMLTVSTLIFHLIVSKIRGEKVYRHVVWLGLFFLVSFVTLFTLAFHILHIGTLFNLVFSFGGGLPLIHFRTTIANPNAILPINDLPSAIGFALTIIGLLGLMILQFDKDQPWQIKVFFFAWVVTLLVATQIRGLVFPVRFVRELGAPLTILSGYFIWRGYNALNYSWWLTALFTVLLLFALWPTLNNHLAQMQSLPDHNIEFGSYDQQAVSFLERTTQPGDCVIVVPQNRYYQYFLPQRTVEAYALDGPVTGYLNNVENKASQRQLANCSFIVAERIPMLPNWVYRLEHNNYRPVASFGDKVRGIVILQHD
jgi:hypothetical protein